MPARSWPRARSAPPRGGSSPQEEVYDAFRERLLARMREAVVGDPADPRVPFGGAKASGWGPKEQSASKYAVIAAEPRVVDQGDPDDAKWIGAGGDPRDRGRFVEGISGRLSGSERMLVGVAWLEARRRPPAAPSPARRRVVLRDRGSAPFTVGDEVVRGAPGTALFLPAGVPHRIENDGGERLHFAWGFDRPEFEDVGIVWDE